VSQVSAIAPRLLFVHADQCCPARSFIRETVASIRQLGLVVVDPGIDVVVLDVPFVPLVVT
jgi:hypothetical protein